MAIPTSRTNEKGRITVDYDKCNLCGLCIKVCPDQSLVMVSDKIEENPGAIYGCIGCGHCVSICPEDAIMVEGCTIKQTDFYPLPPVESAATYEPLASLLIRRRSVRAFKNKPVEDKVVTKILDASISAPVGVPPSDVGVVVLKSKEVVRQFAFDFVDYASKVMKYFTPSLLKLMRPFYSKETYAYFHDFVIPLYKDLEQVKRQGKDRLFYDAPLAMVFYGTPYADPADPVIVATYAVMAAESLGLGSCMIGSVTPVYKRGGKAFIRKYGIPDHTKHGIAVIFGYPKYHYRKAIKRTFTNIKFIEKV